MLRDGQVVAQVPAATPRDELVRLLVGRPVEAQYPRRARPRGEVLLRVTGLTRRGAVEDVSFAVRAGEVVGLAGLVGSGRTELVRAIFGADPVDRGEIAVAGERLPTGSIQAARRHGLGLVPEDRQGQGLVPLLSVEENLGLAALARCSRAALLGRRRLHPHAAAVVRDLHIRTPSLEQEVRYLSGGNQQKVVIGKWLIDASRVLLLDEPTRGIDVGAKVEIYELMNHLTAQGAGIFMVSSDLPEILGMSDRILVMSEGRITGDVPAQDATQELVMDLATRSREVAVGWLSPRDQAEAPRPARPARPGRAARGVAAPVGHHGAAL
ncbi:MAG: sugar ABC transporter ATP-binding protein [Sphaerobacter sp.]|nr:sugar ABC transporter ATP-binding protein [Sphaerobacter sp.]